MSSYTFKFATGDSTTIEVDEKWVTVLVDEDRIEYNANHRETRRHCSLDAFNLDDALFPSDADTEGELIAAEQEHERTESIHAALEKLSPDQRELVEAVFFKGMTVNEYAERRGVSQSAISHQKAKALKNLKKFL